MYPLIPVSTTYVDVFQVSRMHVALFKLALHKKTKTMILVSGSKSPVPRVVGSNGLAKVLSPIVEAWTPIRKTIQRAGQINHQGNGPEPLQSDLPLRSPCPS